MNRIENKFAALKDAGKKALITFLTAGDPNITQTKKHIVEMIENGADLVEIGIPFSDPAAEGPVIQAANERALKNGISVSQIMQMVQEIRQDTDVPLVYLLYFNTILQYGLDAFFCACRACGIDGVIIPDLPYEEAQEIAPFASKYDILHITLIAPTSEDRIKTLVENARGFLYCVSSMGVTGVRRELATDFTQFTKKINKVTSLPKAIGFGISSPQQVQAVKPYFDGVIVGSAIVHIIHQKEDLPQYIASLRQALDDN
ncbi:MAG: tryptophan synthase subunit alpha [Hyphomonadaceae bacterium]|nr:tryptophan synthase subunit alpha [Clostridia bacterium]